MRLSALLKACLTVVAASAVLSLPPTHAEGFKPTTDYKAVNVITSPQRTMRVKVYQKSSGHQRQEMEVMGSRTILITNPDKGKVYSLSPRQKRYQVMDDLPVAAGTMEMPEGKKPKPVGTGTVQGEKVTEYRTTSSDNGATIDTRFWLTEDNILIKAESKVTRNGRTFTMSQHLEELERKELPASLFEVPADYTGMDAPMGMSGATRPMPSGPPSRPAATTPDKRPSEDNDMDMLDDMKEKLGEKLGNSLGF